MEDERRTLCYREYVTIALCGGVPEYTYHELIFPQKEEQTEQVNGEEIAQDIISRAGLKFGG